MDVEAILMSRQRREKLIQCLYENLMSNNFLKKTDLKKKMNGIINLSYTAKDSTKKFCRP